MPTFELETAVYTETNQAAIAGLDEAGRGALAGPVVAAAVILPWCNPDLLPLLQHLNDSKKVTAKRREALYTVIQEQSLSYGVGQVAAATIDEIGILPATKRAMQEALAQLTPQAAYLLIDGRIRLKNVPTPQQAVVRGDGKSLTIAAASILAKVTRDRLMVAYESEYPDYGFAQHKGYGTQQHMTAIAEHGATPIHRHSFAPLRQTLW